MKKLIYGALFLAVLALTNCSSVKNDISNPESGAEVKGETFILVAENSSLEWDGGWIGGQNDGKSHNGAIAVTSGTVTKKDNGYSGNFTVDMNTIKCTDIKDEKSNTSLVEDLESEYFFKVAEFPKVEVSISSIDKDSSSVTVKVLGIPITQILPIKVSMTGKTMNLMGNFDFDFQEANIQELFANPKENETGGISSKIKFNLNVELIKK